MKVIAITIGQENGNIIARADKDAEKSVLEATALESEKVQVGIGDKKVVKIIIVPNKIVNIVVK